MGIKKRAWGLASTAGVTILLWQFPLGRYFLYPFTILAVWFHEMGHGICAMALGGSFLKLQLFADGSGYAAYSGAHFLGQLGLALIAAAGPLGPAIAGSLLIFCSLRPRWRRFALSGLAGLMLLSALVWIRALFGFGVIVFLALLLLSICIKGSNTLQSLSLQFLGVQACISIFLQIDYLFIEKVSVGDRLVYSDTGQMAAALFLPYWFWAGLLTGLTLLLPAWSLARTLKRSTVFH